MTSMNVPHQMPWLQCRKPMITVWIDPRHQERSCRQACANRERVPPQKKRERTEQVGDADDRREEEVREAEVGERPPR